MAYQNSGNLSIDNAQRTDHAGGDSEMYEGNGPQTHEDSDLQMYEGSDAQSGGVVSEKEAADELPVEFAPVDSTYSWVVVVCAAFNLMCVLGIANSFGVFSTYYINYIFPDESATSIAWIGTLVSLFMLGGAITTGPLTDRFGFRLVALTGTGICCVALLLASFTHTLWQLVLTQGAMFGLGAACIFSPSVALPVQWHDKHRSLATGIAVAGSGAGGMVFSQLIQRLIEATGHKWCLRTLALVILCTSGTSGLFYKRRVPVPRGGTDFMAIAKDIRLIIVGMGGFFVNIGYFVPWYYLPTAAIKIGQSKQSSTNLVLYLNAGSTVGRILAAYVAIAVGPINSIAIAYAICAVLVLVVMLAVRQMAAYIALAVVYGGLSASFVSITPLVLTDIFGPHSVTTAMGIMNMWCSLGVLIGNPSQGAIYQRYDRPYDSFTAISVWGFSGILLAACSYVVLKTVVIRGTNHRIWSRL